MIILLTESTNPFAYAFVRMFLLSISAFVYILRGTTIGEPTVTKLLSLSSMALILSAVQIPYLYASSGKILFYYCGYYPYYCWGAYYCWSAYYSALAASTMSIQRLNISAMKTRWMF